MTRATAQQEPTLPFDLQTENSTTKLLLPTLHSLAGQYFYLLDLMGADLVVAKAVNSEEPVIIYCFLPQTLMIETAE